MERHRDRFASRKADDAPWWSDFDAMGRKTMIRRLLGRLPMSVELRDAFEADTQAPVPTQIAAAPAQADQIPVLNPPDPELVADGESPIDDGHADG